MALGILGAVGDFLPVAAALALSPFPIIAMVLLLGALDGARLGIAFTIGWTAGLGLATAILGLAAGGIDELSVGLGAGMQILLGLGLVWAAWRKWRTRPRRGEQGKLPGWAASLGSATPRSAATIGAMLGGVNPKSIAFAYAAAAAVAARDLGLVAATVALALFVALASGGVYAVLIMHMAGGPESAARLETSKAFLLRNNNVILMIILLLAGMKVLGSGLQQLGG